MAWTNYAYVNGRFVPEAEATVSIFDRGFLYGDGCFETMRVYGGKIFRLERHQARLASGLKELQFELPVSEEDLRAVCVELVARNGILEGFVRVYLTRGTGEVGLPVGLVTQRTLVVIAQRRQFQQLSPFRAIIASYRVNGGSPLTGVKSANRLLYLLARLEAAQQNAHEAILLNEHGKAVEFTASNLFVIKNGELFTPPLSDGALPGVTRDVVLVLAAKLRLTAYERSFGEEFVRDADELFATNSLIEIAPISSLGEKSFAETIALRLREAYRTAVHEELGLR
jgi:branched-chain amino acid aminotransferase